MRSITHLALIAAIAAIAATAAAQDATIIVETRTLPADANDINVRLEHGMDIEVISTVNTLRFDARAPIRSRSNGRPDCEVNPEIDKGDSLFTFDPPACVGAECTGVHAIVASSENLDPIPSGSTLYTCAIDPDTGFGTYRYFCNDPLAFAPDQSPVDVGCRAGEISIDPRASIRLVSEPADTLYPPRTVRAEIISRAPLRRFTAQLAFPSQVPLGLTRDGMPACRLDPPVDGITAEFSCASSDCDRRAALELTAADGVEMRELAVRCELVPDLGARRDDYPLVISSAAATTVGGDGIPVDRADTTTQVFRPAPTPEPAQRTLFIGSLATDPNSTVQLPIILRSDLPFTDIIFGVRRIPELDTGFRFRSDGAGRPICAAVPPLQIVASSFTPEPCDGTAECGSIELEIAADGGDAFPEGTNTIATCELVVDRRSDIGGLPIVCQFVEGHSGSQTISLDCAAGQLDVGQPTPTPSPTATRGPITPTPTRPPNSGGGGGSSGGCQVGDGLDAAPWWLLAPVWILARRRRTI